MQKDFDSWNSQKKLAHGREDSIYFYEREIWWCTLGLNVGFEQDGKSEQFTRPVLILKKFSKNVFVGIPLSTTKKQGKYYYSFDFNGSESTALLSQIRLLDAKRLDDKMGRISEKDFQEIRKRMKELL